MAPSSARASRVSRCGASTAPCRGWITPRRRRQSESTSTRPAASTSAGEISWCMRRAHEHATSMSPGDRCTAVCPAHACRTALPARSTMKGRGSQRTPTATCLVAPTSAWATHASGALRSRRRIRAWIGTTALPSRAVRRAVAAACWACQERTACCLAKSWCQPWSTASSAARCSRAGRARSPVPAATTPRATSRLISRAL
mmetsp:Transcript_7169/g.22627  ORF Transcript_7169/g.22627 Transcript_7169/m.22627 type:complete len:201 (+) Transcript_7169:529-1131(+)